MNSGGVQVGVNYLGAGADVFEPGVVWHEDERFCDQLVALSRTAGVFYFADQVDCLEVFHELAFVESGRVLIRRYEVFERLCTGLF